MPRYFFHVHDGQSYLDDQGADLPDTQAAQVEAVHHAGELLAASGATFWNGEAWRIDVADVDAHILFSLAFTATLKVSEPS